MHACMHACMQVFMYVNGVFNKCTYRCRAIYGAYSPSAFWLPKDAMEAWSPAPGRKSCSLCCWSMEEHSRTKNYRIPVRPKQIGKRVLPLLS